MEEPTDIYITFRKKCQHFGDSLTLINNYIPT